MGDQDKGIFIVLEIPFQPLDMLHIQIIGRLIQKQDIRFFQKQLAEQYLRSLSARKLRDILIQSDLIETEGASDLLHFGVDNIEIMRHQKVLDRSEFLHHGVHLFLRSIPHLRTDVIHLLFHLKKEGECAL